MSEHPHELLAEYVDGALEQQERARIEAHLGECDTCREETALARHARAALSDVREVEVPFGTTERVVRRARSGGLWSRPTIWVAAGAATAAAVVVAFAVVAGSPGRLGDVAAPAPEPAEEAADESPEADAGGPELSAESAGGRADFDVTHYPVFRTTDENYTAQMLAQTTRSLAGEAETALEESFPPSATDFYRVFDLRDLSPPAQRALGCATQGVPPDRTVVPFVLEEARFRDEPAYLVAFLRGADPDVTFDRLQLLVVSRESCDVRHFAHQRF